MAKCFLYQNLYFIFKSSSELVHTNFLFLDSVLIMQFIVKASMLFESIFLVIDSL